MDPTHVLLRRIAAALDRIAAAVERPAANPATSMMAEALSKADAATYIGVDVATIEQLIRTRQLDYVQIGQQRGRVIPRASLTRFLAEHCHPAVRLRRRRRNDGPSPAASDN